MTKVSSLVLFLAVLGYALAEISGGTLTVTSTVIALVTISEYIFSTNGQLTTVVVTGGTLFIPVTATGQSDSTVTSTFLSSFPNAGASSTGSSSVSAKASPSSSIDVALSSATDTVRSPNAAVAVAGAGAGAVAVAQAGAGAVAQAGAGAVAEAGAGAVAVAGAGAVAVAEVGAGASTAAPIVPIGPTSVFVPPPGSYLTSYSSSLTTINGTPVLMEYVVLYTSNC